MKIVSIINQKGGVGKTTTVVNLSAALARLGHSVMVLDLDPQANASTTLGKMDPYEVKFTTANLLLDKESDIPAAPWHDSIEEDVRLIYGHVGLTRVDRDIAKIHVLTPGAALKRRLGKLALGDEIVLIDCAPSLSLLTVNALVASDYYIVPMESGSKYSLDGYGDLQELIRDVSEDVNPRLSCLGVLITKHDGRKNVCKGMKSAIEKRFGELVFRTAIASAVRIQDAEGFKKTIFQLDRQSTAARDFMALGREVLERLHLRPLKEDVEESSGVTTAAEA